MEHKCDERLTVIDLSRETRSRAFSRILCRFEALHLLLKVERLWSRLQWTSGKTLPVHLRCTAAP